MWNHKQNLGYHVKTANKLTYLIFFYLTNFNVYRSMTLDEHAVYGRLMSLKKAC